MDYARQRIVIATVIGAGALAAAAAGLSFNGAFSAKVAAGRSPIGPLQFGVDGQVGHVDKGDQLPIQTSSPFDGPTDEERALLLEARRVFAASWNREQRMLKIMDPDYSIVPPPDMFLPTRHLTQYEKNQIRQAIVIWNQTKQ